MRRHILDLQVSNSVVNSITFSEPSDVNCLVPSKILINPSILSNPINKDFESIKFLYEMS